MSEEEAPIPLHEAAQNDRHEEVLSLIASRASLEETESTFGWYPLHLAAGAGASRAVEALLASGASLEVRATDGETPLHVAAADGQTQVIRQLVEAGASLNVVNNDGETPLHVAVQHADDCPNLRHVRALVELKADPNVKDGSNQSVFDHAGLYSKNLDRAEEVRQALAGAPAVVQDPDDVWPDTPGELQGGVKPLEVAEALRELGNARFREQRFADAVRYYFKAKRFLPTGPAQYEPVQEGDHEGARARACAIAVSSNAALCKLKLGDFDSSANICDGVLRLDPQNVKAWFRKALALRGQGEEEEAEAALRKALELDPKDAAVQKELAAIAKQRKTEKEKEKRLAQKMFG